MPLIPYPNVPNVPGVPQVLRNLPAGPPPVLGAAAGIAQLVRSFLSKPVWGVYKQVKKAQVVSETRVGGDQTVLSSTGIVAKRIPVVVPDSIRDFGYQKEWSVTGAPTQDGSFADYNRVATPFEIHLRMTKGGSEKDRTTFLKQIEALGTTELYDIITPEKTYLNCNFLRLEVTRTGEKGAYWLSAVDVYFREIRVVSSQYTKTQVNQPQSVSAANVQNNGTQQGQSADTPVPQTVTR